MRILVPRSGLAAVAMLAMSLRMILMVPRTVTAAILPHSALREYQPYRELRDAAERRDSEQYPYLGPRFARLVAESYRHCGAAGAEPFAAWLSEAYQRSGRRLPGCEELSFEEVLQTQRRELEALPTAALRARREVALGVWCHRLIKTTVPRFSLDRGYEFCHMAQRGERQCFLQSVLIASLLQEIGVDAGVVMVYANAAGAESNIGHAVTLVKLSNGQDVTVDASEREPLAAHRGLFVRCGDYRFVHPVYQGRSGRIIAYRPAAGATRVAVYSVRPLDLSFIESQFWYYRGERAPHGVLSATPSRMGLEASANYLRASVRLCANNPLATYMLGRTYLAQGQAARAQGLLRRVVGIYARCGWVPPGPKSCLASALRSARRRAS